MAPKPDYFTPTDFDYADVVRDHPVGRGLGWVFYAHPILEDDGHVLAISLDYIGDNGPIVFDTNGYDVPEYL